MVTENEAGRQIKVAVAQIDSVYGDIQANLEKHLGLIDAARAAAADVLVFPELSLTPYCVGDRR